MCKLLKMMPMIQMLPVRRKQSWMKERSGEIYIVLFTIRRYASMVLSLSVRPSVCPLHASFVSKQLNMGSRKQCANDTRLTRDCSYPKLVIKDLKI